jgi:hypothetical protein
MGGDHRSSTIEKTTPLATLATIAPMIAPQIVTSIPGVNHEASPNMAAFSASSEERFDKGRQGAKDEREDQHGDLALVAHEAVLEECANGQDRDHAAGNIGNQAAHRGHAECGAGAGTRTSKPAKTWRATPPAVASAARPAAIASSPSRIFGKIVGLIGVSLWDG